MKLNIKHLFVPPYNVLLLSEDDFQMSGIRRHSKGPERISKRRRLGIPVGLDIREGKGGRESIDHFIEPHLSKKSFLDRTRHVSFTFDNETLRYQAGAQCHTRSIYARLAMISYFSTYRVIQSYVAIQFRCRDLQYLRGSRSIPRPS